MEDKNSKDIVTNIITLLQDDIEKTQKKYNGLMDRLDRTNKVINDLFDLCGEVGLYEDSCPFMRDTKQNIYNALRTNHDIDTYYGKIMGLQRALFQISKFEGEEARNDALKENETIYELSQKGGDRDEE